MAYQITLHEGWGFIEAVFTDEITPELMRNFLQDVAQLALKHRCAHILSDLRDAHISGSTSDIFFMAKHLAQVDFPRHLTRAIVVGRNWKDVDFWKTTNFNQGYENIALFNDYVTAINWLLPDNVHQMFIHNQRVESQHIVLN